MDKVIQDKLKEFIEELDVVLENVGGDSIKKLYRKALLTQYKKALEDIYRQGKQDGLIEFIGGSECIGRLPVGEIFNIQTEAEQYLQEDKG